LGLDLDLPILTFIFSNYLQDK